MELIFEKLYNGEVYPSEQIRVKKREYIELEEKIEKENQYFRERLSLNDCERFERLDDMYSESSDMYNEENFYNGVKLGVLMMIEIFIGR